MSPDTVQQNGGAAGGATTGFPAALLDRFEPLERCGEGSEAEVWRARRRDDGRELAVKVHFPGRLVEVALLRHLRDPGFRRHVPEIVDFGRADTAAGQRAWVALEYLPRTLTSLMADERRRGEGVPPGRASELVAELAALLRFWQERIERNPLDFKPDNLLVRPGRRIEIVLADFGGVAAFTASQQIGPATATLAYMPPENIWQEKRSPWPWWCLGEIVFELVTGRPRYRRQDGSMLPDQVLQRGRVLGAPDLQAVPDGRWRLLISGLLTRTPEDRWTYQQVSEWLDGGSPTVVPDGPGDQPAAPSYRPITFVDGRTFHDPAKLAEAMLDAWQAAADWLAADGRQRLLDWLQEEVQDNRFDTGHLRGLDGRPARAHLAVTAFGAAFAPDLVPRYRGQQVDAEGLLAALNSGPDVFGLVRELVADNVPAIAAQYHCAHALCDAGERCALLDRVAREVPEVVSGVQEAVAEVGRTPREPAAGTVEWRPLSHEELDQVWGLATLLTLQPERQAAVTRKLGRAGGNRPAWWRAVRAAARKASAATVAGRTALVTAAVLDGRAATAPRPPERQRGRQQGRRREQGRQRERRREQGRQWERTGWWQPLLWGGAAAVAAMPLLAWAGVVLRLALAAHTADLGPLGRTIGVAAARQQARLLPVLMLAALEAVAVSRGRRAVLVGVGLSCGALGYLAPRLPGFTLFHLPAGAGRVLVRMGGAWGSAPVPVAVAHAVVGLLLCGLAADLARRSASLGGWPGWPARAGDPARATGSARLRRLTLAPLMLLVLLAALWAAETVRVTALADRPVRAALVGALAARHQSELLLAFAALAIAASLRRPGYGHGLFACGVAAAVVLGLWAGQIPPLEVLRRPMAEAQLVGIAGWWGRGVFWAALLLYLPAAAAGAELAYERLRRA